MCACRTVRRFRNSWNRKPAAMAEVTLAPENKANEFIATLNGKSG